MTVDLEGNKTIAYQFSNELVIEIETVAFKMDIMNTIPAEYLVHCKRITQSLTEYRVEQQGKK
jgi:hypothetical protein